MHTQNVKIQFLHVLFIKTATKCQHIYILFRNFLMYSIILILHFFIDMVKDICRYIVYIIKYFNGVMSLIQVKTYCYVRIRLVVNLFINRLFVYLPESTCTTRIPAHAHRMAIIQLRTIRMLGLTSDLAGKHKLGIVWRNSLTQSEPCNSE